MKKYNYSIFVNTCDSFEDCWNPFFKLFSIYWPDYKGIIYLNTEYKDFTYNGLNIICTKVCETNNYSQSKRATWSQCLTWALKQIDTDIILYMQEDYFLKEKVKNGIVEEYVGLMSSNVQMQCIHLTDQAVLPAEKSEFQHLNAIIAKQAYRVCCQAALWKKTELQNLIRINEDAWEFEKFGSLRSALLQHNYYVVDPDFVQLNKFELIPYIFTGIVQGRWNEEVIALFEKNEIEIDFSKRGFIANSTQDKFSKRLKRKLKKISLWNNYFIEYLKNAK